MFCPDNNLFITDIFFIFFGLLKRSAGTQLHREYKNFGPKKQPIIEISSVYMYSIPNAVKKQVFQHK